MSPLLSPIVSCANLYLSMTVALLCIDVNVVRAISVSLGSLHSAWYIVTAQEIFVV